jgi:hypothetical protein
MTLTARVGIAFSPGSGGTDQIEFAVAVYRDGVLQPLSTYDGTNGSSHLTVDVVDQASAAELAQFLDADLSQATAAEGASHYWAEKTVSGIAGAQVLALITDLEWNDGVNPVETLFDTEFYQARFNG